MRPGHFWLLKFGKVPGSNRCVEKKFMLGNRMYEEYKDVRFGNGDCALVVDLWLHRVDEDDSGLTFEEGDPSADTDSSEAPVAMIVNSSELCDTTATRGGAAWNPAYTFLSLTRSHPQFSATNFLKRVY